MLNVSSVSGTQKLKVHLYSNLDVYDAAWIWKSSSWIAAKWPRCDINRSWKEWSISSSRWSANGLEYAPTQSQPNRSDAFDILQWAHLERSVRSSAILDCDWREVFERMCQIQRQLLPFSLIFLNDIHHINRPISINFTIAIVCENSSQFTQKKAFETYEIGMHNRPKI